MREVTITHGNGDWKKTFRLDDLSYFTVGTLKDLCSAARPDLFHGQQVVIYDGVIIPSDKIYLGDIVGVGSLPVDVTVMAVDAMLSKYDLRMDNVSLSAAKRQLQTATETRHSSCDGVNIWMDLTEQLTGNSSLATIFVCSC
jgi:hypothetical protein